MTAQVRRAIQQPNGIYPDPYKGSNKKYIRCDELRFLGHGVRVTVTVVVDSRVLGDGLPLGVKTAWQTVEIF